MVISIESPSEEYKQKIASAITESMAHLLGRNGTKMVFFYAGLKRVDTDNLDPNEVYDRLGDLIPCLRKIFGPGSMIIEKQITAILTATEPKK
ncbi:MAG: hypothetical protein M1503_13255 [Thaumarchaeota archaeon]|nr:hypothetical protein [Nitrososphaerota archaeon]